MSCGGSSFSQLPEALRKKLSARRAIEGSAQPETAAQVVEWVTRKYASKRHTSWKHTNAEMFKGGLGVKEKTLASARREAHALLSKFDLPALKGVSLQTLAVLEKAVWTFGPRDASASPAIALARGLGDAVEAVFHAMHLEVTHLGNHMSIVPSREIYRGEPPAMLRHLVCAASDGEYEEARKRAEKLRKTTDLDGRIVLAFFFPDEPWGNVDLKAALAAQPNECPEHFLMSAVSDPVLVRRWMEIGGAFGGVFGGAFDVSRHAIDLAFALAPKDAVAILSDALARLLIKPKGGPVKKTPPCEVALGLTAVATREAAAALAPYANHAIVAPIVLAYFRDHSSQGEALLSHAKGAKLKATASRVLGKGDHQAAEADVAPTAKPSELPAILRETPWRSAQKKPAAKDVVVQLALLGLEGERVKLTREPDRDVPRRPAPSKDALANWKKSVEKGAYPCADCLGDYRDYREVPKAEGLWAWNEHSVGLEDGPLAWVKKHGLATIPGFVTSARRDWVRELGSEGGEEYLDAAMSLISPRIAPVIAEVAVRRKRFRRAANGWLVENVEIAAFGLVPNALSDRKELRSIAEGALVMLARQGKGAVVRKVAHDYGVEAERGIATLLAQNPLAFAGSIPKLPECLRLDELPAPKLSSRKAVVDAGAVSAIVEMLQISAVDDPYAGLASVREACDEASLGDLAVELFEQWLIGGAPGRHEWMLYATNHFPSVRGTRRVAEVARAWAHTNKASAERACVALAADGGDSALMHLGHIAETARFAELRKSAGALLRDAASARGLSDDELGDRTVPDAGLGPDGTITLSYGSREFVVACDPSLHLTVREKTEEGLGAPPQPPRSVTGLRPASRPSLGVAVKTLPRPAKTDDAALAKKARERFDHVKKDLEAIAKRQSRRLEQAMVSGRTWSVEEFEVYFASQSLMRHLARALVWESLPNEPPPPRTFRIAEDGSYADEGDSPFTLPTNARVRLAHPARTPSLVSTWSTLLGNYEIVQPFEQVGRAVHTLTPHETKAAELGRAAALRAPARKLLGTMESRGWRRDDVGFVSAWLRQVPGRRGELLTARWPIKPAIEVESIATAPDVMTEPLKLVDLRGEAAVFGLVDDVAFSEIVRDVEAVRSL